MLCSALPKKVAQAAKTPGRVVEKLLKIALPDLIKFEYVNLMVVDYHKKEWQFVQLIFSGRMLLKLRLFR